jgi:SAM-dependent methyltransferase
MIASTKKLLKRVLGLDSHRRIFDRYYREDVWVGGGSGTGSSAEVTEVYRDFLVRFMRERGVKSVVDLGCGDWRFSQLIDWTGIDYLGVDVSSTVLAATRKHGRPGIRFAEIDGSREALPPADLLIAKDVLQHWSNAEILRFLPQLQAFRFALITNGADPRDRNADIRSGLCRPIDLSAPPFELSGETVLRYEADEPKAVFLWTNERPG